MMVLLVHGCVCCVVVVCVYGVYIMLQCRLGGCIVMDVCAVLVNYVCVIYVWWCKVVYGVVLCVLLMCIGGSQHIVKSRHCCASVMYVVECVVGKCVLCVLGYMCVVHQFMIYMCVLCWWIVLCSVVVHAHAMWCVMLYCI